MRKLLAWMMLAVCSCAGAAESFSAAETQMVRSVLERQATLMHVHELAIQRAAGAAVRELASKDRDEQKTLRAELLSLAQSLGMTGVDGLQAPGYFQRAEMQLQSLSGASFDQQYLLLTLQCHAFLDRALNAEIRTGTALQLIAWARQRIDVFEQRSRGIDHALYDLK